MNPCQVPTATVFQEDVSNVRMFRSVHASKDCGATTWKHVAFGFERGSQNMKGAPRHGMSLFVSTLIPFLLTEIVETYVPFYVSV